MINNSTPVSTFWTRCCHRRRQNFKARRVRFCFPRSAVHDGWCANNYDWPPDDFRSYFSSPIRPNMFSNMKTFYCLFVILSVNIGKWRRAFARGVRGCGVRVLNNQGSGCQGKCSFCLLFFSINNRNVYSYPQHSHWDLI